MTRTKLLLVFTEECLQRFMIDEKNMQLPVVERSPKVGSTHEWLCVFSQNKDLLQLPNDWIVLSLTDLWRESCDDVAKSVPCWFVMQKLLPKYLENHKNIRQICFVTSMFFGIHSLLHMKMNKCFKGILLKTMTFYDDIHSEVTVRSEKDRSSLMGFIDFVLCPYKAHFNNLFGKSSAKSKLYHWFWHASKAQTEKLLSTKEFC